jgi:hypothetical protein
LEFHLQPRPAEPGVAAVTKVELRIAVWTSASFKESHMNETKVNTNIGDVASPATKNPALPTEYVGCIDTPHGAQFVDRGAALDHAYMRSKQLSSLLLLMSGDGLVYFRLLNSNAQDSLLWLARQLATETEAMFDIVLADQEGDAQ